MESATSIPSEMKTNVLLTRMSMEVRNAPVPAVPPGGMLIKVRSSAICGSDVIKIRHTRSAENRVIGHEIAGDVVLVDPDGVLPFAAGDRVVVGHVHVPCGHCTYCRKGSPAMCRQFKKTRIQPGGYAEWVAVSGDHMAHTIMKIPESVSYDQATFVDPLACCIRAVNLSATRALDRVMVVGAGIMGVLFIQLLHQLGVEVFVLDISDYRLEKAKGYGADHVFNPARDDFASETLRLTNGEGVDTVMLTVTTQQTLDQSLEYLRDGGAIMIFGGPVDDKPLNLSFYDIFRREIRILGSYSATLADMGESLRWIESGKIDVQSMITGETDLAGILPTIEKMDDKVYKVIVKP